VASNFVDLKNVIATTFSKVNPLFCCSMVLIVGLLFIEEYINTLQRGHNLSYITLFSASLPISKPH
jgi:hypothetical protein